MKKLIYIAGPYTAETREGIAENIRRAEECGKRVLLAGYVPVIPHTLSRPLNKHAELKNWQHLDWMEKFCLPLLARCDAMLLMSNWHLSKGASMEKDYAEKHGISVIENIQEPIL